MHQYSIIFLIHDNNINIIITKFCIIIRTKRTACYTTRIYGGTGGAYFDDGCTAGITQIDIHANSLTIRGIQATYRSFSGIVYTGPLHGYAVGSLRSAQFYDSNEHIIAVVGTTGHNPNLSGSGGNRVLQLAFLTNRNNRVFGPYGGPPLGDLFVVYKHVVSFIGQAGFDLDGIGFRYLP